MNGYEVTQDIRGAHPKHVTYPLLEGDILVRDGDFTFSKVAPGLAVLGFVLTEKQIEESLRPVTYNNNGLEYWIEERHA